VELRISACPSDSGNEQYIFTPPTPGKPELWKRLKEARSVSELQGLAICIGETIPTVHWNALHSHAVDFLKAKKLRNYPGSNRPRSDEKRLHFVAKVLSGFMQDIAPATATKRLSRLSLSDAGDIQKSFEEEAIWYSKPQYRTQKMKRLVRIEREKCSVQ
jgi:hypothetical protein